MVEIDSSGALVRVTYPRRMLTSYCLPGVLAAEGAGLERAAPGAVLADLRGITWALSLDSAMAALMQSHAPGLRTPVALLTRPGEDALVRQVAEQFASAGLMRRVFHSEAQAREWLSLRGRIAQARTAPL